MARHDESPLRRIRRQKKLSMETLAHAAGVSTATVYRAEHSRHETREETWQALAEALGVSIDSLFVHNVDENTPAAACAENGAAA